MRSVIHYLKAVDKVGSARPMARAVVAAMKAIPTDDPLFGKGYIRSRRTKDPSALPPGGQETG